MSKTRYLAAACLAGGLVPDAQIPFAPGYQVPFAERVRREAGVKTAAVGLITGAGQAERIVADGRADLVFLARELLRRTQAGERPVRLLGLAAFQLTARPRDDRQLSLFGRED